MYVLGQMLTPDSRAQVLGEATTFGDEWLEHEAKGKREHEIALRHTGTITCIKEGGIRTNCQMYS